MFFLIDWNIEFRAGVVEQQRTELWCAQKQEGESGCECN